MFNCEIVGWDIHCFRLKNLKQLLPLLHCEEAKYFTGTFVFLQCVSISQFLLFSLSHRVFIRSRVVAIICSCRMAAFQSFLHPHLVKVLLISNEMNYSASSETGDNLIDNSRDRFFGCHFLCQVVAKYTVDSLLHIGYQIKWHKHTYGIFPIMSTTIILHDIHTEPFAELLVQNVISVPLSCSPN